MGQNYTYVCRSCGKDIELMVGEYGCKGWDRSTRSEILEGKYGKKAKVALEEHPGCYYHFEAGIFRCDCGYVKSYDSLVIHGKQPVDYDIFYMTRHRCPRCNRTLERMEFFPLEIPCKCGSIMDIDRKSLFRW